MDFFNGNTSGVFGSFPLRLRFAWVDFGPFLVGQAASLFMDYDVFPNVLDYQGPPGMVLMRQPIFAYRPDRRQAEAVDRRRAPVLGHPVVRNGGVGRQPGARDHHRRRGGQNIQDVPDLTANLRYTDDYGHLQVAGICGSSPTKPRPASGPSTSLGTAST